MFSCYIVEVILHYHACDCEMYTFMCLFIGQNYINGCFKVVRNYSPGPWINYIRKYTNGMGWYFSKTFKKWFL